jgi:gas vesicle protein
MIKLEKDKKKTDRDQIKEWQDSITELREQYNQILEDSFSTATAGILDDVLSVTNDFVSAWYDAFKETGDGMSGLEQTFNDMLLNMLKQQSSMQLISPYINSYKEWLKDYVDIEAGDADLSIEEARAWAERVKETMPEVSSLLQNFFSGAEGLLSETGELSELGKGIQGVTETTAQALEAYLNSIRFFVADDNDRMQRIEAWLTSNDTSRNPILNELRTHTNLMQSIKDAVESVVGRGVGGAYFKVQMM